MSNNLQEINNLAQLLAQKPQLTIPIGHNCFERIDQQTIKQLCVECGGKGFYLLMQGFPNPLNTNRQGEIVACECENGFKYSKMIKEHG